MNIEKNQTSKSESSSKPYVPQGMPPLDLSGKTTSFFEFWPTWLFYLPVAVQWIFLSIRYGSLSLPLIANPSVPLSGMVGVAKSSVFDGAGDYARDWILPWLTFEVTSQTIQIQVKVVLDLLQNAGLNLPIVGKPELGCRGVGVKLLKTPVELESYLGEFPVGGSIQFQQLSQFEAEAGVFYVRYPGEAAGKVTSLTLKYTPYVVGDGDSTLRELINQDPRAGELIHLYESRHREHWDKIISNGEPYRLIFAASHSRGAIFRDAAELINTKLSQSLDRIFDDIPDFYYGRLDVKFKTPEALADGTDFEIIEINGASSESINIWDRNSKFGDTMKTLLQQYGTLFKLGAKNRERGHKPPGLMALLKAWQHERQFVRQYPNND